MQRNGVWRWNVTISGVIFCCFLSSFQREANNVCTWDLYESAGEGILAMKADMTPAGTQPVGVKIKPEMGEVLIRLHVAVAV